MFKIILMYDLWGWELFLIFCGPTYTSNLEVYDNDLT